MSIAALLRKMGWNWNRPIPGRALFVVTYLIMIGMLVYALHLAGTAQTETRAEAKSSVTALCTEITTNRALLLRKSRREQRVYVAVANTVVSPALKSILFNAAREDQADEQFLKPPAICEGVLGG